MAAISAKDYADKFGVTTVAVTRACKGDKKLKGISSYQKYGNAWVLEKEENFESIEVTPGQIVEKAEKSEADF